jgi:hypothetical protein
MNEPTETCRGCGAALAPDQRYCLNCGERRGGPRVEYRDRLAADAAGPKPPAADPGNPSAPNPPPAGEADPRRRDYAPLAAVAGIAVLGIMLLIGVLIGRGTGSTTSDGGTPQVVTVESSGAAAARGEAEEEGGEAADATAAKGSDKKSGKQKASKSTDTDTGSAPVASDADLQALQEQSPDEYQESSAKLPDEIATPGAAPATDGKAPGGGSGGTTIE